ncbi:MFS transporter [Rhizobium rhizogenes]|uniref:MFS transporter n=1 Tax=Rhizobium rhizogenes TaxID=359 RepID=UPI0005537388|nr:MFS transporter [Rhizobium rhizogenes]QUE80018.1 MFS transporter [Rhizobium rhizogenes]TQO78153.1 MFS transporter [Rhizobium rhizogenes]TRB51114.1 MFS transporter [Rhizobium rhizogenes]
MRSDDDVVLDADFAKTKIVSDKTEQWASSHGEPRQTPPLSRAIMLLFAVASGLAVANAYFAHPMLDVMADDLGLSRAHAGLIVGATQVGYGLGLILLVPIGDLIDRRRLVIAQSLLSVAALIAIGFASSVNMLLVVMAVMGLLAVVTQAFVAYAASLAPPAERGHIVGVVTSGIVLGILLARTVAGTLTDLSGWRTVYLVSAAATLIIVALLWKALPRQEERPASMSYPRLIGSLFGLLVSEPALLIRGIICMLIFANITTLLTPLVLPLSAPPFSLSHTAIGLFGLAGVAGALGATRAGRWTDRGLGQRTTGISLALMLLAWGPISLLPHSILWLVIGVVVIDFGLQAVHVTNQAMIYRVRPDAQSRLTAGYMVFYSIGSALGSSMSTLAYAYAGWLGVCLLGAGISALALAFWGLTLRVMPANATRTLS